ncbi:MAG: hypothetical protein MJA32_09915 [Proteobacteria bacterium]|nr:hypothetical protein [Pseudomonadota bacterium]
MNRFHKLFRWAWSILVVCTLAFATGGCEGDDGATGPAGAAGAAGPAGQQGPPGPPGPSPSEVEAAVAMANVESCSVCHEGAGDFHQAIYNTAYDDSDLELTITDVSSLAAVPPATGWDLTIEFSIAYNGAPYDVDPSTIEFLSFKPIEYSDADGGFVQPGFSPFPGISAANTINVGGGDYSLTVNVEYDIDGWDSGAVGGFIAKGQYDFPDNPYAPPKRVRVYEDQWSDAFQVGAAPMSYSSLANPEGCAQCHGTPYRKHGNVDAVVDGVADFVNCKNCHFDDRVGGHFEWQQMVDDPLAWATGVTPDPAVYAYDADLMNVTHMSHAMEFPYPQSMANCVTCHEGNVAAVLDDGNFTPETCKSCHVVNGVDAWPEDAGTTLAGMYAQDRRPPPLEFLWTRSGVEGFHDGSMTDCTTGCHGAVIDGFTAYHTGYDTTVYDDAGSRYTDLAGVAIDDVTIAGDLLTVDFSSVDATVNPTLAISFYGWDTRHYIVPAHERDGNRTDAACQGFRPGCNIEWEPGSTKPFFTEDAASVAGDWRVTFDMAGFQAYKTDPIPTLIADGVVKYAEITILPELEVGGEEVNVDAVSTTFDLGGSMIVDNYFQGTGAAVDIDKCTACHENTGVLIHAGAGRYGDSMQACKVCHNPTYDGSHLEMMSRSIDSYVHAIHRFMPLDEDDVYNADDPVFNARNDLHKHHTFPNFTILSCEGCHVAGAYDVPDQSKSMPGNQSDSWTLDDPSVRAIGTIPETVTGAASRACGSCHRADLINHDDAGGLASFDAHTASFGTFVENAPKDEDGDELEEEAVLFGIIDKIMEQFE